MKIGVLIPSYQPDEKLTALIEKLISRQLDIIVVDDGSTALCCTTKQTKAKALH